MSVRSREGGETLRASGPETRVRGRQREGVVARYRSGYYVIMVILYSQDIADLCFSWFVLFMLLIVCKHACGSLRRSTASFDVQVVAAPACAPKMSALRNRASVREVSSYRFSGLGVSLMGGTCGATKIVAFCPLSRDVAMQWLSP